MPPSSGPTPLNPRGRGGDGEPAGQGEEKPPVGFQERSESSISNEAQAVRTLASAHRLASEIENDARRRADEITADAELRAQKSDADARGRSEAMIAEAKAERDRIWDQIRAGVGRATSQVGDLLRIREELRLDLREAMRESGSAIQRLEEGGSTGLGDDSASWLPTGPGELPPPAPHSPPIAGRASEVSSPLSPRSAPGPAAAPAPAPGPPPAEAAPAEALSSLRAGPFESFLEVMRFERELASLPAMDAVYVRRFSNGEVDVEVDTGASTEELTEALGAVPRVAAVQAVGDTLRVRIEERPQE